LGAAPESYTPVEVLAPVSKSVKGLVFLCTVRVKRCCLVYKQEIFDLNCKTSYSLYSFRR
jgi:hypothetical protein